MQWKQRISHVRKLQRSVKWLASSAGSDDWLRTSRWLKCKDASDKVNTHCGGGCRRWAPCRPSWLHSSSSNVLAVWSENAEAAQIQNVVSKCQCLTDNDRIQRDRKCYLKNLSSQMSVTLAFFWTLSTNINTLSARIFSGKYSFWYQACKKLELKPVIEKKIFIVTLFFGDSIVGFTFRIDFPLNALVILLGESVLQGP